MIFKQIDSGGDRNYAYLVACEKTKKGALVDPSPDARAVMSAVNIEGIEIEYVINTHSHFDHSQGNEFFRKSAGNKGITFINCSSNTKVEDGQTLKFGEVLLEFIHTPGHTEDSICIKVEDKLLTGDTLFVGKVGGTYSREEARKEFESLKKIMRLAPDTEIWPGHNYGVKTGSTIRYELKNNPFILRLDNFKEFFWLKQNWSAYKLEHGIK